MTRRSLVLVAALATLALVVALPTLAAQPSWAKGRNPDKAKVEKSPITLSGTVEASTDASGRTTYTLTDDGTTYTLHAGPPWFFGADYPLEPFVGEAVTVDGEIAEGTTDVDVLSIDGTALREAGKPPWAGGWKAVGELHPGWSQEKADRFEAKADKFGGCFPPGRCKDKPEKATEDESAD
ncbi:MAG: hypothetical protein FIA92_03230 [Chloroflexi bacterium]|nr:hypothetical protein [Chloroflexota bacterium]